MTKTYQIEPKLKLWLPDRPSWPCWIVKWGRELMENIPNGHNKIVVPLYNALISSCRIYGDMGECLVNIESGDSWVQILLAYLCICWRMGRCNKVRKKMKALGIRKKPGCSSIEVNDNVHEFLVGVRCISLWYQRNFILNNISLSGIEEDKMETHWFYDG